MPTAPYVRVRLVEGPLAPEPPPRPDEAGAVVVFDGVVRPTEAGRPLRALRYEAYEPMTTRELLRLAHAIRERFALTAIDVRHSVGLVAAGGVSFTLVVASPRRKAALSACDAFIDEMKQAVPLWKVPVFEEGGSDVSDQGRVQCGTDR